VHSPTGGCYAPRRLLVVPHADPAHLSSCPTLYQFSEQFKLVGQHRFLWNFGLLRQLRWRLAFVGKLQPLKLRFLQQYGRKLAFLGQFRFLRRWRSLKLVLRFERFSREQFQWVFQCVVGISRLITQ